MEIQQQPARERSLLLIAGIALPFALMAFVLLYRATLIATVPAPRYAAVYMVKDNYYGAAGNLIAEVKDNHLIVTYRPPTDLNDLQKNATLPKADIYLLRDYDGVDSHFASAAQKFTLTVPNGTTKETALPLPVELQVGLIPGNTAPDGYAYTYNSGHNDGVFSELMVGSSSSSRTPHVIAYNGRMQPLFPKYDGYSYYNFDFIGWVMEPVQK